MLIDRYFTLDIGSRTKDWTLDTIFDAFEWEQHETKIFGRDGTTIVAQAYGEFPKSWSVMSRDIVATKYFRKSGVPSEVHSVVEPDIPSLFYRKEPVEGCSFSGETSLRQIVKRLVGSWVYEAFKGGYVDDDVSARAMYDELAFMLLDQMAAPNSPQWFNSGLYWAYGIEGQSQGNYRTNLDNLADGLTIDDIFASTEVVKSKYRYPQAGACFILGIEDNMVDANGIFDTIFHEAQIFKGGSGAGSNFSALRGRGEPLSGGGTSSGLMSWLHINDRAAGAIKSGGTTRRAAKMVVVDTDHPDIIPFIDWKVKEELKVHSLISGFSSLNRGEFKELAEDLNLDITADFEGEAYLTVSGQNSNNSIRLSAALFRCVDLGYSWRLIGRIPVNVKENDLEEEKVSPQGVFFTLKNPIKHGEHDIDEVFVKDKNVYLPIIKRISASELEERIVRNAWACADPGVQFDDVINAWHTIPSYAKQNASNPCSEYTWIDNSCCNLASLNVLKFHTRVGATRGDRFDIAGYRHAIRLWMLILEISVFMMSCPTKEIAAHTFMFRTTGLGIANLGAYLMREGVGYDSELGHQIAGMLASLLTSNAYICSGYLANALGPFYAWDEHKSDMLRVLNGHLYHASGGKKGQPVIDRDKPFYLDTKYLKREGFDWVDYAVDDWEWAIEFAEKAGIRNAQTTVIAPTGTIGLAMSCDTTGIEPDFSLIKHKKLAGNGYMQIVNRSVQYALERLGYDDQTIREILAYVEKHGHIEGSIIKEEHLSVFDCANAAPGSTRYLPWQSHVDMLWALQPFISGAISKTINMPNFATLEDVRDAYRECYAKGIKACAIYRDGCKASQVLNSSLQPVEAVTKETADKYEHEIEELRILIEQKNAEIEALLANTRRKLPDDHEAKIHRFNIQGHKGYVTVGLYPEGDPGEIFINMAKEGSTMQGLLAAYARAASFALQYGMSLEKFIIAFKGMKFAPMGMTMNRSSEMGFCDSIIDYIAKHLEQEFLTPKEYMVDLPFESKEFAVVNKSDGSLCSVCGEQKIKDGVCYLCPNCGINDGCGGG